jgi:PIN domain nuclease of toxin-antitoxin system
VKVCLDAWAVLAWLDGDQPGCDHVEAVLSERPLMSWVNAMEVYYRLERDHGRPAADDVLRTLRTVLELELPSQVRMIETARIKAAVPIALGDCFAITTAAAHHLLLLTGDPEILERDDLPCEVQDLRPVS